MKINIKILTLSIVLIISSVIFPKQASAKQGNVSFQVFYDELSPYGQWVNYPNYGYVWIPDAGSDFVPYSTGGHWIYTDYGWTWVSDYNWGWAPFHYGRWYYDNSFGWIWVPDNEWGPSWVTWRRADGYYGWEPMEPGVSVSVSFGNGYNSHNDHWMFVRDRDIDRSDINHYYVNRSDHDRIAKNSTVINKTYVDNSRHTTYVSGPAREDVQKVTGRKVSPVAVKENNKPGQNLSNGQLSIYRPQVKKSNDKGQKIAPSKVTNIKDVKKPSERNTTNQPKNVSPQDNNKKEQQQKVSKPANTVSKAQPSQPQKSNTSENNKKEQQQNNIKPQGNNNNKTQSSQPQKSNPQENSKKEQQQKPSQPANMNSKAQPSQPPKANPSDNNKKEQQQNPVKPKDNNNNNARPSQPQNVNPPENNKKEQQQNASKPANLNSRAQPAQPPKQNPSENKRQEQQPNTANPQNNNRSEQPKEPKPEEDKKRIE